jgi:phospholipid transport system substrate-binding protein
VDLPHREFSYPVRQSVDYDSASLEATEGTNMRLRSLALSVAVLALAPLLPAFAAKDESVVKPLKTIVGSVRYGRDLAALKHFHGEEQSKLLLADEWTKASDAQKKEFTQLFHTLFAKMAFPKIRDDFKHLETVLYEDPQVEGDKASVGSTIVILHPLKKQELKVKYSLMKDKGAWKVVDVAVLGDWMLKGIREDQVAPILKEGGMEKLLQTMRDKAKELEKVPLK